MFRSCAGPAARSHPQGAVRRSARSGERPADDRHRGAGARGANGPRIGRDLRPFAIGTAVAAGDARAASSRDAAKYPTCRSITARSFSSTSRPSRRYQQAGRSEYPCLARPVRALGPDALAAIDQAAAARWLGRSLGVPGELIREPQTSADELILKPRGPPPLPQARTPASPPNPGMRARSRCRSQSRRSFVPNSKQGARDHVLRLAMVRRRAKPENADAVASAASRPRSPSVSVPRTASGSSNICAS